MSNTQAELKARLLARVEATIDRLLADERLSETMKLSEIEAVIGVSAADFRQGVLAELVADQQATATTCPDCGGALHNKGHRRKRVVTLRGEVDIERTYYQCRACGRGYFPPG